MPFDLRFATLTTALGVQGMHQRLTAPGVEGGLFDPNRTTSVAGFMFNEFRFSETLRAQVSGRIEQAQVRGAVPDLFVDPLVNIERDRRFTPKSAAVGLLKDLPWDLVGSVTAQYVERAPRAPELLSRGVHEATETFDIGNPNLKIESAKTIEVGIRRPRGQFRFEATAYYTRFSNFIFRNLTGETCAETVDTCSGAPFFGAGGDLNQAIYSQRDATFRGGEFQSQLDVMPLAGGTFGIENQFDVVRATFTDGTNVPRIPPVRVGGGVFWRDAQLVRARQPAARVQPEQYRDGGRDADRRLRPAQGRAHLHHAAAAERLRRALPHRRRRRQQPAQRRHPQQRVVQEGRGADAGPRRAVLRDAEELAAADSIGTVAPPVVTGVWRAVRVSLRIGRRGSP